MRTWHLVHTVVGLLLVLSLSILTPLTAAESPPWRDLDVTEARQLTQGAERLIVPQRFRTVVLDWTNLGATLQVAPLERSLAAVSVETVLSLPLADGTFGRFRIEESPMMEASLAASLPDVKTYRGYGLDDPSAFVRLDTTPAGFHAMIRSNTATIFIDPYTRGERNVYVVYDKADFVLPESERPVCHVDGHQGAFLQPILPARRSVGVPSAVTNGATFKQVRLAVAATGEYTGFHGGTVPLAQAAIVTTINRVNAIFENDLAIRMNLVDNTSVVFTNAATDPYTNSCTGAELDINQTTLDNNIGATSYDLGHVMGGPGGGGGGRAGPGPCLRGIGGNFHARGCTGSSTPAGDPFDIDLVAHEIGHQWGAPHSFNGTMGSCAGGRSSASAYEPGSGSTIMAYSGICGTDNLQTFSDDYFHGSSLEAMASYDPTIYGATQCIQMTASGNTPPSADAGVDRNIPKNTPFTLCGTGTDPDAGDNVTYLWEEYDLGPDPGGPPNNSSSAPFFRSFAPSADNCRTFPKLSDILDNTPTNGEILPNVAWAMKFRLTVLDNHPGAVGGAFDQDDVNVTVSGTAGPFQITSPNAAVTWTGNTVETVTWDVANTDVAPISCSNVNIRFSGNGGANFSTMVLANTPNDGSQAITVPNVTTAMARLKVSCSDNVFFDINNVDFAVNAGACIPDPFEPDGNSAQAKTITPGVSKNHSICPAGDNDWSTFALSATSAVTLQTSGSDGDTRMWLRNAATAQIEFDDDGGAGLFSFIDRTCGVDALPPGTYFVEVDEFGDNGEIGSYALDLTVVPCGGGCPTDLVLANQTLSGTQTLQATSTATLGPNLIVNGADIVVNAPTVTILGDTEISGTFAIGNNPSCP